MKTDITNACLFTLTIICMAEGCSRTSARVEIPPANPTIVEVDTTPAISQKIIDYREFTGRTLAIQSVEIRVQVNGYLIQSPQPQTMAIAQEGKVPGTTLNESLASSQPYESEKPTDTSFRVTIREGDCVMVGTPIFEIDPAPYRFALAQAEGTLVSAQAQLKRLTLELDRAKTLLTSNSISQAEFDLAVANEAETAGQIETYRASVDRAKLNLQFTRVISPIEGLLGRTIVTNGNLVSANTNVLTTIVSIDPIHAYFDVDEDSLLDYRARIRTGDVRSARETTIPVQLGLANETDFPHLGVIDFVDNVTNSHTGNTQIRARFPNSNGALSPGLFAKLRVPFTSQYDAILIPTRALAADQKGRFCMVVDDKNVVHRRIIKAGTTRDSQTVIADGIQVGEDVVVSGLQKIRDGATVRKRSMDSVHVATQGELENSRSSSQVTGGNAK